MVDLVKYILGGLSSAIFLYLCVIVLQHFGKIVPDAQNITNNGIFALLEFDNIVGTTEKVLLIMGLFAGVCLLVNYFLNEGRNGIGEMR